MRLLFGYLLLVVVGDLGDTTSLGAGPLVLALFFTVVGAVEDREAGFHPLRKIHC